MHGLEADVDVMIESKAKELALLHYREKAMGCSTSTTGDAVVCFAVT